jgi:pyruvate/2-oxoglutarate dehydrogenase complex dihydrolipoamide acyltransferase (E2) component
MTMARIAIEMPKLGYDMESGTLGRWLKQVGDTVARGEAIAEIETDKTTVEMESTTSGTIVELSLGAGEEASVGTVIGYIESDD